MKFIYLLFSQNNYIYDNVSKSSYLCVDLLLLKQIPRLDRIHKEITKIHGDLDWEIKTRLFRKFKIIDRIFDISLNPKFIFFHNLEKNSNIF